MIRGVNKRVVEVINSGDEYFEKVILFVSPEKFVIDNAEILKQADVYIKNIYDSGFLDTGTLNKKKKFKTREILKVILPLILGALFTLFIVILLPD